MLADSESPLTSSIRALRHRVLGHRGARALHPGIDDVAASACKSSRSSTSQVSLYSTSSDVMCCSLQAKEKLWRLVVWLPSWKQDLSFLSLGNRIFHFYRSIHYSLVVRICNWLLPPSCSFLSQIWLFEVLICVNRVSSRLAQSCNNLFIVLCCCNIERWNLSSYDLDISEN